MKYSGGNYYGKYQYNAVFIGILACLDSYSHTFTNSVDGNDKEGAGEPGKGIKTLATTIIHERMHEHVANYLDENILSLNYDGDGIPYELEESDYCAITTDITIPDTYDLAGTLLSSNYSEYGDQEIRCRRMEETAEEGEDYIPANDWANPGCNSFSKYGPEH